MMQRMGSKHPLRIMHGKRTPCEILADQTAAPQSRTQAGFTLVETLLSLAILVLLTGVVAMGIPAAASSYSKTIDSSNAQVVLTNATTALRNELGMASNVWYEKGEFVPENTVQAIYTSEGYIAQIRNADQRADYAKNGGKVSGESANDDDSSVVYEGQDDVIKVDYFAGSVDAIEPLSDNVDTKMGTHDLVPEAAITDNLKLSLDTVSNQSKVADITYDETKKVFTVKGVSVKNADGVELARVEDFEVKAVMMEDSGE